MSPQEFAVKISILIAKLHKMVNGDQNEPCTHNI